MAERDGVSSNQIRMNPTAEIDLQHAKPDSQNVSTEEGTQIQSGSRISSIEPFAFHDWEGV
jgi:hypothetical protein